MVSATFGKSYSAGCHSWRYANTGLVIPYMLSAGYIHSYRDSAARIPDNLRIGCCHKYCSFYDAALHVVYVDNVGAPLRDKLQSVVKTLFFCELASLPEQWFLKPLSSK